MKLGHCEGLGPRSPGPPGLEERWSNVDTEFLLCLRGQVKCRCSLTAVPVASLAIANPPRSRPVIGGEGSLWQDPSPQKAGITHSVC